MAEVFQGLAGMAMLLWYAAAIYVGIRLVRIGMRDAERPAWLMGTYLLVAMGLGGIAMSIPITRGMAQGAVITLADRVLLGSGCVLTAIGIAAILAFTREVFRRDSVGALWLALTIAAMVIAGLVGHGLTTGFEWNLNSSWGVVFLVGTILANGWTSCESLAYYRLMRKRRKIGLADPLLTNRFLLWGIGAGATVSLLLMSLSQQWASTLRPETYDAIRADSLPLIAVFGLSCALCYWFAFAPAGWYARWIERTQTAQR